MSEFENKPHLSEAEVYEIIHATQSDQLLMVGGQSITLWRNLYASRNAWLNDNAVTSEDIDFLRNRDAATNLSNHYDVEIRKVNPDDNSPSDSQLLIPMNDRIVVVDFLRSVHGVSDKELNKRAVLIQLGMQLKDGKSLAVRTMHPFDCVVSRLSNVNGPLRRVNAHSKTQTEASMHIFKCHLDSLIEDGKQNEACKYLQAFEYVIKNNHIGKNSHRLFGKTVDPISLLASYRDDERLHPMWREKTLGPIIDRLTEARDKKIERDLASGQKFPGYKTSLDIAPEAPKPKI